MALTIKEQLDIINGIVAPTDYTLNEYVEQVGINTCQTFLENSKTVNFSTQPNAGAYLNRLQDICREFINYPNRYTPQLVKILIAIYANTGDYATVQAATDAQWVTFL